MCAGGKLVFESGVKAILCPGSRFLSGVALSVLKCLQHREALCVCVCVCVCACVRACVRACARARACVLPNLDQLCRIFRFICIFTTISESLRHLHCVR